MADLLPSSPDPSAGDGGEPRVVGVDSDDADDLLAALQSETARDILGALYDDPATPSSLAEEVDTSIQNVRYHLERLENADLVEVADTVYSEKGREMNVYAPAAKPLVVFAGSDDDAPGVESALSRLLGALGVLGLSSLLVQRLFGGRNAGGAVDTDLTWQGGDSAAATTTVAENATAPGPNGGASGTAESGRTVAEATQTAAQTTQSAAESTGTFTEEVARTTTTVTEAGGAAVSGLPPGLLFFAGGVVVLLAFGVAWYLRAD
ncbi:winged helix-turn-helix domain-containing protein [Halorussus sp. MSC15.2]|uniref:ArsR/SmtB family transcription factor n=1 Tax=Halorussus sp. MSC15.2 TaxID=2283638 RepID=UPI0013D01306|nr:winged helix-turn-helix domain-containing protein [Halorussus sp. MSC15.2]NEU57992.1 helix-turn-helix transcriptional regulator [Halorussus sp. MSC15.2]